jgi:hypothetical protein
MKYTEKAVGRCLTERCIENFDLFEVTFNNFIAVPQDKKQPKFLSEVPEINLSKSSQCHPGYFLYGVDEDGSLTFLKSIVDSSD